FFTLNPSAAHGPISQVMYGDISVDISSRFPQLIGGRERVLHLAHGPVVATVFFEFSWRYCFECLPGWHFKAEKSSVASGFFGQLHAFYGSSKYIECGSLH
ncbi:hypothetical protein DFJ58DRAFT_652205, partial [Suillus subalutaceus]|uniref:uncharacterized protein n=1 Tax=Suillus subalutaceus TaxID=48586 RepID=UPI001B863C84